MISRRAYSYAPATRDVFIEIPAEDGEHDGSMAGKLYLSFYGTQDAAANWQETRSAPLASIGFTRGKCYQSIFCHKEERISTLVHGDDYVSSGHPRDLAWLRGELEKAYEIQTQLVGSGDGAVAEGKVLNRILRWHAHGWELEADPRHCELVIGQLGLGNSKGLSALGNLDNDPDNSDDAACFAATPPLEAKRVLCSQWATERRRGGEALKLHFADARKAYFNGKPNRAVYLRLPKELGFLSTTQGKLVRCCDGTRDAGSVWEAFFTASLVSMVFLQGRASPCCFYHPAWDIQLVVNGDDFTALGTDRSLNTYEEALQQRVDTKLKASLGEEPDDVKAIRALKRILQIEDNDLKWEADPRHSELLIRSLGLESTRLISTPGHRWPEDLDSGPVVDENGNLDRDAVAQEQIDINAAVVAVLERRMPKPRDITKEIDGQFRSGEVHLRVRPGPEIHEIIPYPEIYKHHPKMLVFSGPVGDPPYQMLSSGADAFTGNCVQSLITVCLSQGNYLCPKILVFLVFVVFYMTVQLVNHHQQNYLTLLALSQARRNQR